MKISKQELKNIVFKPPFIKRMLVSLIGCIFMGICVSVFNLVNFGTDPFSALNYAISRTTGIGFGTVELTVGLIELLIVILVAPKDLGFGTLFNMVFIGYIAQFFDWIIEDNIGINSIDNMWVRVGVMLVTVFIFICAVALYINAGLGTSPYDALPFIIHEAITRSGKIKISQKFVRMSFDAFFTIAAFLLGMLAVKMDESSEAGVITVLTALFLGPVIEWMAKIMGKVLKFNREN